MIDLQRKSVFLSASFPPRDGNEKYEPIDPGEITDALVDFTDVILESNGTLTTAAHPMITPMLIYASRMLGVKNAVTVYRSDWYESDWIPRINELENDELGTVIRTKKAENEEKSLRIMREEMIEDTCYSSALFIGGMQDVEIEYSMFLKSSPDTLRVRVAGTGGAAACLPHGNCESFGLTDIEQKRTYPYMAIRFAETLAQISVPSISPIPRIQSAQAAR